METLTIAQVAEQTGLSTKALARRIERGTLPAVVKDGKRRVPISALETLPREATESPQLGQGYHGAATPSQDFSALLLRLEQLAGENMKLRLLTEQSESQEERLRGQLFQKEAQVRELEDRLSRRRWWRRKASARQQEAD